MSIPSLLFLPKKKKKDLHQLQIVHTNSNI